MDLHEKWMRYCLALAQKAFDQDEVPVGAIVVKNDELIAEAYNLREGKQSVMAHAEILAIEKACEKLQSWRLTDCVLYTSLEPCVMCAGAIIQSRIGSVIYGASDAKGGAQTLFQLFDSPLHHHHVKCTGGICAQDSSQLLKNFFSQKRK